MHGPRDVNESSYSDFDQQRNKVEYLTKSFRVRKRVRGAMLKISSPQEPKMPEHWKRPKVETKYSCNREAGSLRAALRSASAYSSGPRAELPLPILCSGHTSACNSRIPPPPATRLPGSPQLWTHPLPPLKLGAQGNLPIPGLRLLRLGAAPAPYSRV